MKEYSCPICFGESIDLLGSVDMTSKKLDFLSLSGVLIDYYKCNTCDFIFALDMYKWSLEDYLEKIYNEDYIKVDPDYIELRPKINAKSIEHYFKSKEDILHLDWGGGNGVLSQSLRKNNYKSYSYDPFVDKNIKFQDLLDNKNFNLVTAFEVFEHVPDIHQLMRDIRYLLASDGIVYFSTLLSDVYKPENILDWWYVSPINGHVSIFSKKSLDYLAKYYGFTLSSIPTLNFHFFVQKNIPSYAKHLFKFS